MDVPLVDRLLIIGVLLGRETDQALLKEVDFERVKAGDERVDAHIVLEPVDQVRIRDVLGDNVARLPLNFLLLADHLDSTTARRCTGLHNVHVAVVVSLSVHRELAIVVWEEVSLRAEVVLREDTLHPTYVLPHHVFAANLERLREMV